MTLSHAERSALRLIDAGARVTINGRRAVIVGDGEGMTTGAGVLRTLVALGLIHPDLTPVNGEPCGAADCQGAPSCRCGHAHPVGAACLHDTVYLDEGGRTVDTYRCPCKGAS